LKRVARFFLKLTFFVSYRVKGVWNVMYVTTFSVNFYSTLNPSHSQNWLYRSCLWFCSSGTLELLSSELFRAAHWLLLSLGEFTSSFSGSSSDSTHFSMRTLHCSGAWALGPSCSDWQACLPHWPRQCVSHILFKCLVCVIHRSSFCAMAIMLLV